MRRRQFLQATTGIVGAMCAGCGAAFFNTPGGQRTALAHNLRSPMLTPFVDPLPCLPVLQPTRQENGYPLYQLTMSQFSQKLHRDLPPTTVWGFEHSYPGPTIEARSNQKILVRWINNLPTNHLLPIDHTLDGAGNDTPAVRTVTHLHGGHVSPDSDGGPTDWFTPGHARTYTYSNCQPASTLWYHDHAQGITRLNIYAGLAGFYLLRDEIEAALNLPHHPFELPLLIQDRVFSPNGQLSYPDRGITHPVWVPDFAGDTALVNGKVWPFLEVEPRKYRFRLLNGCNGRLLRLALSSGQPFYQIGADGGFLPTPVETPAILLAPAERADVIIDFSGQKGATITLTNNGPGTTVPLPQIMQFRVTRALSSPDTSHLPTAIGGLPHYVDVPATNVRDLTLNRRDDAKGNPIQQLLNGQPFEAPVTEKPKLGSTEIWRFINLTGEGHPIHLHLVQFHVLDRQSFDVAAYQKSRQLHLTGPLLPRFGDETGLKDTVKIRPNEVTRIKVRFTDFTGNYVWHCHILEHEDNDMMRPFEVIR